MEDGTFFFKFVYLRQLYEHHFEDFGIRSEVKEKMLKYFPHAQEQSDRKNSLLVFEQGMQQMMQQAIKSDLRKLH